MLNAFSVLFSPGATWQRIARQRPGLVRTFILTVVPVVALACLAEVSGLMRWGEGLSAFGATKPLPYAEAMRYGAYQFALGIVLVFVGALFVSLLASGFHMPRAFGRCFVVAAFGLAPIFWAQALDGLPFLPTWLCWGVGAVCCVYVLYQGIGLVLEPDQSSGFGLYLVTSLIFIILTALTHLVGLKILHGRIQF